MSDAAAIDLIPLDVGLLQGLMQDTAATLAPLASNGEEVGKLVAAVAGATVRFMGRRTLRAPWISYLGRRREDRAIVGVCSFKGDPDEEAQVEIAYFTFPGYENQGVAGGMAGVLVAEAAASEEARHVIAHTLPQDEPSDRLLTRLGFTPEGTVSHPEDGQVRRWRLSL